MATYESWERKGQQEGELTTRLRDEADCIVDVLSYVNPDSPMLPDLRKILDDTPTEALLVHGGAITLRGADVPEVVHTIERIADEPGQAPVPANPQVAGQITLAIATGNPGLAYLQRVAA